MNERIILTILLPVSIDALAAVHRGLETMKGYQHGRTFMRQVGPNLEIFETIPVEPAKPNG